MSLRGALLMLLPALAILTIPGVAEPNSNALFVSFKPEVALTNQGVDAVNLRIRISEGGSAQLWLADSCSIAPSSAYTVRASGNYQIPVSSLGKSGTTACLSSSDGLKAQVQLIEPVGEALIQPQADVL